ncbi:hypothetical protein COLO4_10193 [Corchorus olitorius]|uniref:Uncharacterized protein n=1 Tax=Corchorus olitorius TaxID=93759 RepID=A0A1R3K9Q1_9ROSI|nr:hypothetical protein COLO4_10193 [Corchorus olitorius]
MMAAAKGINGALVLVLCLLVLQGSVSGCFPGHACLYATAAQSRKMLLQAELKENNEFMNMKSSSLDGSKSISGHGENSVKWEMRTVPSGPDPLHHNGGSSKKPRVDP